MHSYGTHKYQTEVFIHLATLPLIIILLNQHVLFGFLCQEHHRQAHGNEGKKYLSLKNVHSSTDTYRHHCSVLLSVGQRKPEFYGDSEEGLILPCLGEMGRAGVPQEADGKKQCLGNGINGNSCSLGSLEVRL